LSAVAVEARNVVKQYGSFKAVDDVSIEIDKGGVVALLGPNGAGKTTFLKCALGLINFRGDILLNGVNIHTNGKEARRSVGYLPQHVQLYDGMSVQETLRFFASLRGTPFGRIRELLEFVGLELWGRAKVTALSQGMKQRLMLAVSLLSDPPLLLMDEPTANLDIRRQLEFRSLLSSLIEQGKTIVFTTHILGDVTEFTKNILVLNKGKLIATGTVEQLLKQLDLNAHLYILLQNGITQKAKDIIVTYGGRDITEEREWIVSSCDPDKKLGILNALNDSGFTIKDFRVEDPNLEDAFMRLTGETHGS
jgi:ABC-type multidrug transport system ATPase subunit